MNVTLVVTAVAVVMMLVEALRPGRRWPQRPRLVAARDRAERGPGRLGVPGRRDLRRLDGRPAALVRAALGTAGGRRGRLPGHHLRVLLVASRAPRIAALWRWFHQVHHSPQRIEIITSFYKHPFEILVNGVLSSAILYLGVGLTPEAAAGAVALSGLGELVYHWNVSTPYWMGFVFQRPESHCVHHQEGVHSFNYSDLPLWDMLFGTFRNPRRFEARCGWGRTASTGSAEMLRGVDVDEAAGTSRA